MKIVVVSYPSMTDFVTPVLISKYMYVDITLFHVFYLQTE